MSRCSAAWAVSGVIDLKVWRVDPFECTLTAWVRQTERSASESLYSDSTIRAAKPPNVMIELVRLFD